MEVFRTDAEIARDRSLAAIETTSDRELGVALWRAAKKFNQRIKEERADRRLVADPLHRAAGGDPAGAQARYEF
jgi:hypothetical protein